MSTQKKRVCVWIFKGSACVPFLAVASSRVLVTWRGHISCRYSMRISPALWWITIIRYKSECKPIFSLFVSNALSIFFGRISFYILIYIKFLLLAASFKLCLLVGEQRMCTNAVLLEWNNLPLHTNVNKRIAGTFCRKWWRKRISDVSGAVE